MNFNLPSLPWQVAHSPGVPAVIRHSTFETARTARQVLGAHPKNNAVCRLLHSLQDELFRRWQRTPNEVNILAHPFNVSNLSSFPSGLHRKCGRTDISTKMPPIHQCSLHALVSVRDLSTARQLLYSREDMLEYKPPAADLCNLRLAEALST
jgi:hypothetical protein